MVSKFLIIALAAVVVGLVAVMALYVYISAQGVILAAKLIAINRTDVGPIHGSSSILSTAVYSYNNSGHIVEAATVNYNYSNVSLGYAALRTYSSNPISRVYLVDVGFSCFKCLNENDILNSLSSYMQQYGLMRNSTSLVFVNLSDIGSLPGNSTLIIPSGLMPSALLPFSGSNPDSPRNDIRGLLSKGDTIIYVGYNFSRSIENGINYVNSNSTISALSGAGITSGRLVIGNSTANTLYFSTPSFSFVNGSVYGPVSYKRAENGTIVALSDYPSVGWQNASDLAHDITVVLFKRFWLNTIGSSYIENITGSGQVPLFTTNALINNTVGVNGEINSSYSLVTLELFNRSSFIIREHPFTNRFQNNGTLGIPGMVGDGQTIPLSISAKSAPSLGGVSVGNFSKNALLFHVDIYNGSGGYIYSLPVGFFNTSLGVVIYTSFDFRPGYYIASLRDINNRPYEDALFYIPYLRLSAVTLNFVNGTFVVRVVNNNQTGTGIPYNASLNRGYQQSGVVENGLLRYTLPRGSVIPYGNQSLSFDMYGTRYTYSLRYSKPIGTRIPPLYIEFGIAAIVIVVLNLLVKDPNRDDFFVDVPLFPPTQKTEVKATSPEILGIFDTVNERFGWRHMPLTAEEIKSGISSNIRYDNMPIMITSENSSEILYRMANKGEIDIIPPYFMPRKWGSDAKHDIEYLVIFRKLRDFAVKNAMLFTDLDSAGETDMVATNRGVQNYIYIYSKASGVRGIKVSHGTRLFLVFIDSETRLQFMDKLSNTYGNEAERLRMNIEASSITLLDTENLNKLLY